MYFSHEQYSTVSLLKPFQNECVKFFETIIFLLFSVDLLELILGTRKKKLKRILEFFFHVYVIVSYT